MQSWTAVLQKLQQHTVGLSVSCLICNHGTQRRQQITCTDFMELNSFCVCSMDVFQHKHKTWGTATMQKATHTLNSQPSCNNRLLSGIIPHNLHWRKARKHPHGWENCWTSRNLGGLFKSPCNGTQNLLVQGVLVDKHDRKSKARSSTSQV